METNFKAMPESDKSKHYADFLYQLRSLVSDETETVSVLANTAAALREAFGFFWVGFYMVRGEELVLGPFQGSVACYRIKKGRGVCGAAWEQCHTVIVPNVEQFPGHIACSSLSRSEIVVPISVEGRVVAVLDIDSDRLCSFDEVDARGLEGVAAMLAGLFS